MNYRWIIQGEEIVVDITTNNTNEPKYPKRLKAPNGGFYDMNINIVFLFIGRHYVPRDGWIKGLY